MKMLRCFTFALLFLFLSSAAYAKSLTIFWAEWDPANQLQELGEMYKQETGVEIIVETTPWGDFQTKTYNEFTAKGDGFDMVVGDSQWVGFGMKGGHYVELTNFFKKHNIANTMAEATVTAYAEYPKGGKRYWAIPLEGDAVGWAYRKDWFTNPKEMKAFKKKYGYKLDVPQTWHQLKDIAEFFHRPSKGQYGVAIYTQKDYDAMTMGVENVLWSFGGSLGDMETYKVAGLINSKRSIQALKFYKSLYHLTPPDWGNVFFAKNNQAMAQGQVAMTMNYFAFFPSLANPRQSKYANVTGYFANPTGPYGRFTALGGQGISINKYSKKRAESMKFLEWFVKDSTQKKWAEVGGFTCSKKVLNSKSFLNATPYNQAFKDSMFMVKDFWAIPEFGDLLESPQRNWSRFIVEDKGTAKQAMDNISKDWQKIFKKYGYR